MQSFFNEYQINQIVSFAIEAGEIASKSFQDKNFKIYNKEDGSQVTSTDIEISQFLNNNLSKIFPKIPIICEEGDLRNLSDEVFFLIDPIDGTSSFISNDGEFSINIALIKNKKPIFGLIYAPIFDGGKMSYLDSNGNIVFFCDMLLKPKKIKIDLNLTKEIDKKLSIITSKKTKDVDILNYVEEYYPSFKTDFLVTRMSSSAKFLCFLEGKSNLYLHFRRSMEWDTASGQALVEALNTKVQKIFFDDKKNKFIIGEELEYKKSDFVNSSFVIFNKTENG